MDDETRDADLRDAGLRDHLSPGVDPYFETASPYKSCCHDLNARNLIVCIDGMSNQFGEKVSKGLEVKGTAILLMANIRPGSRRFQ